MLVVLLGRDRVRRYPWFTVGIGLSALRLMAEELLAGRTTTLLYQEINLALGDLAVIVSLVVLVEVARRAFAGAKRSIWIVIAVGLLVVAFGLAWLSGPHLVLKELGWDTLLGKLHLMQFIALKGETLTAMLAVELGLLVMLFGRQFKAGWRSHTQQIVIGLSAVSVSLLTIQQTVGSIIRAAQAHHPTQEEAQRIFGLLGKLANANSVVYIAALLWWIVWLWLDEPGAQETQAAETAMAEPEITQE